MSHYFIIVHSHISVHGAGSDSRMIETPLFIECEPAMVESTWKNKIIPDLIQQFAERGWDVVESRIKTIVKL